MTYEGIDESNEYLDLCGRNFKLAGVLDILDDLQDDTMVIKTMFYVMGVCVLFIPELTWKSCLCYILLKHDVLLVM
jgi:hypothetical protein